jgi:hypothetical protein
MPGKNSFKGIALQVNKAKKTVAQMLRMEKKTPGANPTIASYVQRQRCRHQRCNQ